MKDITKFETYKELREYQINLLAKKDKLVKKIEQKITMTGLWYDDEKKKIINNPKIINKDKELKYLRYLMEEWRMTFSNYKKLQQIKKECMKLENDFPLMYKQKKLSVLYKVIEKPNGEWLSIITDLMNKRSNRQYSVNFFKRDFEQYTYVAIIANDFDINTVSTKELLCPDLYPNTYNKNNFILYDSSILDSPNTYLSSIDNIYESPGMPRDIVEEIEEILFSEYKDYLKLNQPKVLNKSR